MNRATAATVLLLGALPWVCCRGQDAAPDYPRAKRELARALSKGELEQRRRAILALRDTRDPRALKDLRTGLFKVRKNEAKLRKKLSPLLDARAANEAEIAERFGNKKQVARGTVENLLQRRDELAGKIRPLERAWRREIATRNALMTAIGDLIARLPGPDAEAGTAELLALYEKSRKIEDRRLYLRILAHVRNRQAVAGLVSIAIDDPDPRMRVRALDALALQGDPAGIDAALRGLEDDYWQVRAAAIAAVRQLGAAGAIPRLIERLDREDGRLKDDVIAALRMMSGRDFHDSSPRWKKWWQKEGELLGSIMERLDSEVKLERAGALEDTRTHGFLVCVRKILRQEGLTVPEIEREEARRVGEPAEIRPGELPPESAQLIEAVGEAINTRPKVIRDSAFSELLEKPLAATSNPGKKRLLIRMMGRVTSKASAELLARLVARTDDESLSDRSVRIAAIRGLADCRREEAVPVLVELFRVRKPQPDVLLAAAHALSSIGTRRAFEGLITALGEIDSMRDESAKDYEHVHAAIRRHLEDIARIDAGGDAAAWLAWAGEHRDFKTPRDEELAKGGEEAKDVDDRPGGTTFYGIKTHSKRIVYVLDASGSMLEPHEYAGEERKKIDVAKEELIRSLATLQPDARFDVIFYSTEPNIWRKTMVEANPKNKREARDWIARVEAIGGTNIYGALMRAFSIGQKGRGKPEPEIPFDTIFFLSDGQPTQGRVVNPGDILREISELAAETKVRIHTIGIGKDHDRRFMKALAERTGGTYIMPR